MQIHAAPYFGTRRFECGWPKYEYEYISSVRTLLMLIFQVTADVSSKKKNKNMATWSKSWGATDCVR